MRPALGMLLVSVCQGLQMRHTSSTLHGVARSNARSSVIVSAHWMDHLKFGGSAPSFDVLERAKEYVAATESNGGLAVDWHADDYVFRGSIVGPISGIDVAETQKV